MSVSVGSTGHVVKCVCSKVLLRPVFSKDLLITSEFQIQEHVLAV